MKPGPSFSPLGALGVTLAAVATLIVIGNALAGAGLPLYAAMALGQLAMLGVAAAAARGGRHPIAAIGFAPAPRRAVAGAALIGLSAWFLNMVLVELIVPVERGDLEQLGRLVEQPPLALVLLAVAVAPALCEEVVFRGVLLRGLASRLPVIAALPISSAMFAAYHLKPVQMLPTFTLGLALGALALRAGSIVPSVLAHFLNNAMAILVARHAESGFVQAIGEHPAAALAVFSGTLVTGLAVGLGGRRG